MRTLRWITASFSGTTVDNKTNDCVEVAPSPGGTYVRDSKARDDGVLSFSNAAWAAFLAMITDPAERATWPVSIYTPGRHRDKAAVRPLLDFAHAEWRGAAPAGGTRVEYAFLPHVGAVYVAMRNSASPDNVLLFDSGEWAAFTLGVLNAEFNPALTPA
ncbi:MULTISPECIES: DUF397 domain-containing protein [unclassified Crossiella]|uniref:DUF397 domain-containing protein n=1 Tax=unclassified Crossiella TaxID=2620835 RepID=UPI001FFF8DBD|nr:MULTISPECIES: DUF397 domain-containing protein [unclassified Crossiella]MCK2241894.1 DUF397 domain-containing protein [Crossiella sp. S99.2]MCK2255797.1 DUF397 domain-containing protein [Crossiella sp. S99.1]